MSKKLTTSAFLSLPFLLLLTQAGTCGEPDGPTEPGTTASCHVWIDIVPNVAVAPLFPVFDLGSFQTGVFSRVIPFRVDANTQKVRIGAAASHLYKGNFVPPDPDSVEVAPIELLLDPLVESGIDIFAELGNPVEDNGNRALYEQEADVCGFPGWSTQTIVFESSQDNHFSQKVELVVTWIQPDPEKPMGEYSGVVELLVAIVLP